MLELSFVLACNLDKIICLLSACLLKKCCDSVLDLSVGVVDVDKDLLDCVGVEARRPWVGDELEENFEGLTGLHSDTILSIIESLQQLWIDLYRALMIHIISHEGQHAVQQHDGCEAQIMSPIIIEG